MRFAVSVVTGATPSTICSSVSVSSGACVSNSTRADAAIMLPVAASLLACTVYDTKPAPPPCASFGFSSPRVVSCRSSPVSGSIAWISHVAAGCSW